jgi:formate/nitrite transporter FocA (FNT family)
MPIPFLRKEKPASGDPSSPTQKGLERPSAHEIYQQVAKNARQELERSSVGLAISGFAGGISMGLTALGVSLALASLGNTTAARFVAYALYPLGFIATIVGRGQLFTENTLYPVALVLAERKHFWNTMRLWVVVLCSNVAGAFAFALLAGLSGGLRSDYVSVMAQLGIAATQPPIASIFWSGVIGGWIIALVAWLVSGSHSITGSVALIWLLTFVVGLGGFAHCIATSGEILVAVLTGQLPAISYPAWLLPAVLGNITGGVCMVTLLEYGQVIGGGDTAALTIEPEPSEIIRP